MGLEDLLPTSVTWLWFGGLSSSFHGPLHGSHNKASGFPRVNDPHGQTKTDTVFFYNFILEVTKYHLYYILLVTHQLRYKLGGGYTGLEIPEGWGSLWGHLGH